MSAPKGPGGRFQMTKTELVNYGTRLLEELAEDGIGMDDEDFVGAVWSWAERACQTQMAGNFRILTDKQAQLLLGVLSVVKRDLPDVENPPSHLVKALAGVSP